MAFTWSENVSVGASIDAADVNEIKTNLDTIYSDLGIDRDGCTGAGWSELPVSSGDAIANAQFQEMRDVTDYADTNKCPSDNATYQSTEYTTEDSGYESYYNYGYDSSDDNSVDSGYNSNENTGENATYDASAEGTYNSTEYGTVDSPYNSTEYTTEDSGYNSSYDNGYNSVEYSEVCSSNLGSVNNSKHDNEYGTNYWEG